MTDFSKVPTPHMVKAVRQYLETGECYSKFLTAVICNDLRGAVHLSDPENLAALREWVLFFHWEAPGNCWGSPEIMKAWQASFKAVKAA